MYYNPFVSLLLFFMNFPIVENKLALEIPRRLVDKRIDVALFDLLQKKVPGIAFSRRSISKLIEGEKILLNGKKVSPTRIVKLHDLAKLSLDDLFTPLPVLTTRNDIHIPLLYEDDMLLAIDKPANLQVHPAGNIDMKTVAHFIITKYPALTTVGEDPLRPGIVHRLDRETSGVLVIAKTNEVFRGLKNLFQKRTLHKKYIALVYGHMYSLEGEINKPLMRHSGELKRFAVETQDVPKGARASQTFYKVIARYKDFDLLEVTPKTGRTHQIRVHLASIGNPIVGDKLYTTKTMRSKKSLFPERQMLHAYQLAFSLFTKKYDFTAPLPTDFRNILTSIDETLDAGYDDEALKSLLLE